MVALAVTALMASAASLGLRAAGPELLGTWHVRAPGLFGETNFSSVVFGNGLFVAVGDKGMCATSADGVNWSPQSTGTNSLLRYLAYANGTFVAAGGHTIRASTDGTNWVFVPWPDLVTDAEIQVLGSGNNEFFLTYQDPFSFRMLVFRSTNGISWHRTGGVRVDPDRGGLFADVCYGAGRWVAPGGYSTWSGYVPVVQTSTDMTNWSRASLDIALELFYVRPRAVTYGGDRFVFGGTAGNYTGCVAVSRDGTQWTLAAWNLPGPNAIDYGGSLFVMACDVGQILLSRDGWSWMLRDSGVQWGLASVAYGHGTFVIVGNGGTILQSDPVVTLAPVPGEPSHLAITGPLGVSCLLQAADELTATSLWSDLGWVVLTNTPAIWVDPRVGNQRSFYRAVLPDG